MFDLYLITPDRPAREIAERARLLFGAAGNAAHAAPARIGVQLRSKQLEPAERRALARELRDLTHAHAARLIINGDLTLARDVAADGVQLPEGATGVREARTQLGNGMLIGASRHQAHDVLAAGRDGASFVTLSPVFGVPGKGQPLGLSGLAEIAAQSAIPVFALGGLDVERAGAAIRAGAHGVAVIRQVWDSADPRSAVLVLLAAIDAGHAATRG